MAFLFTPILCFPGGKCPQNRYFKEPLSLAALEWSMSNFPWVGVTPIWKGRGNRDMGVPNSCQGRLALRGGSFMFGLAVKNGNYLKKNVLCTYCWHLMLLATALLIVLSKQRQVSYSLLLDKAIHSMGLRQNDFGRNFFFKVFECESQHSRNRIRIRHKGSVRATGLSNSKTG